MGSQSGNAGEILNKDGLNDILILKGGIAEWRQSNLPLV
jgi:rhodanese-related sulfurtransferase